MSYLGDFAAGQVVRGAFNTVSPSTGAPITLVGGTLQVSKDGSDVTPSGGVTLTTDASSTTGFHRVTINTATDPTTFVAGSDYKVRLAAGTVGTVSVVGILVAEFSIGNRTQAGATLADDGLDGVEIEPGYNARQALALILAALAGKLSGAATTAVRIRDVNDTADRIAATVDQDGNRTVVTVNPPA